MDHTSVVAALHKYEIDASPSAKRAIVNTICLALEIHAQLEEEIVIRRCAASTPGR